jgi:hypothetical protein
MQVLAMSENENELKAQELYSKFPKVVKFNIALFLNF